MRCRGPRVGGQGFEGIWRTGERAWVPTHPAAPVADQGSARIRSALSGNAMRARWIKYRPAPADSSPVSTRLSHPPEAPVRRAAAGERGIALAVAIIVLLVLSMIAAALTM